MGGCCDRLTGLLAAITTQAMDLSHTNEQARPKDATNDGGERRKYDVMRDANGRAYNIVFHGEACLSADDTRRVVEVFDS